MSEEPSRAPGVVWVERQHLRQKGGFSSKGADMTIHTLALTPLISLIAGVLILVMPRLLNYIVALYLIVVGLIGLFPHLAG
jgi:hypothetical protein